jgi:peroxiredoxin
LIKAAHLAGVIGVLWAAVSLGAAPSGQERAQDAGRALIGKPAPRLVLTTIEGTRIDLAQLYGKQAVYLKFWATWCVPCRQQMPHFEHTYETAGPDLAVIAIDVGFNDSVEAIRDYQRTLGITMPIVIDDGHAAAAFNLRVTPQHIVIGRDGRVQYVGHLADEHLDAALVAARTSFAGASAVRAADAPSIREYHVGDLLPPQAPRTLEGRPFPLRDPKSQRPTLMVFLSPWCESYLKTTRPVLSANCRRTREQVASLTQESGVRWLGIASGLWATREDLREYRSEYGVNIPLSLDASGAMFREFDINEVPVVLAVDSKGMILRRLQAPDLETPTTLHAALQSPPAF